jgi:hypothetical protein
MICLQPYAIITHALISDTNEIRYCKLISHQVWLVSERSITCYSAATAPAAPPAQLSTFAPVDGYLRGLLPWAWGAWLLSSSGVTAVAARTSWEERQQQVGSCGGLMQDLLGGSSGVKADQDETVSTGCQCSRW